jgi:hypothetical protein
MSKIALDKYYTPKTLVELVIKRTEEVIGLDNITEFIEPSAGDGAFLDDLYSLGKPVIAHDIAPERGDIFECDYLELEIDYKEGRCVIGNPPFGSRGNLFKQFYNKSIQIADYIVFILPIKQYKNKYNLYQFDLIHSEDLGLYEYSGVNLHCCLNIYKRPQSGIFNKKPDYKLKDIDIISNDIRGKNKVDEIKSDIHINRWGEIGKVLHDYNYKYACTYKIIIKNNKIKDRVINVLNKEDIKNRYNFISTPKLSMWQIYEYLKEEIPELE